jgi:hypothetical protein
MKKVMMTMCTLCALTIAAAANDYEDRINELFSKTKDATYSYEPFTEVRPLEVGQWIMYGQTDDDGDRVIVKYSVVGKSSSTWTLETMIMNEDDIMIMQYEVKGMDQARSTGDVDAIEFVSIKMKTGEDEDVLTIDGFVLSMAKAAYKDGMRSWFHQTSNYQQAEAINVPAGSFAGTTKATSTITIFNDTVNATTWLHPAVPIHGMVKSLTDEGDSSILLDFGLEGATSSL